MHRAIVRTNEPSDCSIDCPFHSAPVSRIGKEVDRLGEDEGAELETEEPVEYERNDLRECIEYLAQFPKRRSPTRYVSRCGRATAERIRRFATRSLLGRTIAE